MLCDVTGSANQHKSQFAQLIEAARKSRAGLKKSAVDGVRVGEDVKDDVVDGGSSSSSVELIADSETLSSDVACPATVTDDNHNNLLHDGNINCVMVMTYLCILIVNTVIYFPLAFMIVPVTAQQLTNQ